MSHKVLLRSNTLDLLNVLFNNICFVLPFNVHIKCTQEYLQYFLRYVLVNPTYISY